MSVGVCCPPLPRRPAHLNRAAAAFGKLSTRASPRSLRAATLHCFLSAFQTQGQRSRPSHSLHGRSTSSASLRARIRPLTVGDGTSRRPTRCVRRAACAALRGKPWGVMCWDVLGCAVTVSAARCWFWWLWLHCTKKMSVLCLCPDTVLESQQRCAQRGHSVSYLHSVPFNYLTCVAWLPPPPPLISHWSAERWNILSLVTPVSSCHLCDKCSFVSPSTPSALQVTSLL